MSCLGRIHRALTVQRVKGGGLYFEQQAMKDCLTREGMRVRHNTSEGLWHRAAQLVLRLQLAESGKLARAAP
eukprot:6197376-Pleurochrysis_carterae.AAC.1